MTENEKIELIKAYVDCYNKFDVVGMIKLLDNSIIFENESNGNINIRSEGKLDFENLALESIKIFSNRQQVITDIQTNDNRVIVSIYYKGTLMTDLPNGLKAGQTLELEGKTYFEFKSGKISYIKDIS